MYFDAHSDIWCDVTTRRLNGETNVFDRCHLERLRKGGVEGSIFVIWVDPPYDVDYVKRTEQIMAAIKAETAECRSFRIVHSYDEMMKANADGKIYIFIGIEGMAAMGKDLTWIDRYYEFGCRHGISDLERGKRPRRGRALRQGLRSYRPRQGDRPAYAGKGDAARRFPS